MNSFEGREGKNNLPTPKLEKKFLQSETEYNGLISSLRTRFKKALEVVAFVSGIASLGGVGFYGESKFIQERNLAESVSISEQQATIARLNNEAKEMDNVLGSYAPHVHINKGEGHTQLHFEHLENLSHMGIPPEAIKGALGELPPEMKKDIESIEFLDIVMPMSDYGEQGFETAKIERDTQGRIHITFYRNGPDVWTPAAIKKILKHELAHANDWEKSPNLTPQEQTDLAYAIMQRIRSGNRFHDAEVDELHKKNPQETLYRQMLEYWAVIVAQYETDKTKLAEADRLIVEKYMHIEKKDNETL